MALKTIGKAMATVALMLQGIAAAHAVDYTLNVPIDIKQVAPDTTIMITCSLHWMGRKPMTRTQGPVPLTNGASTYPSMRFVFTLTDQEAKQVSSYSCAVDGRATLLTNGAVQSNSVMEVGGILNGASGSPTQPAGNAAKPGWGGQ